MAKSSIVRFRGNQKRSRTLLVVAVGTAVVWAISQLLMWPLTVRIILAVTAAIVGVAVPELRVLGERADQRKKILGRLELIDPRGNLPRVRDVTFEQLHVHAAQAVVPYIPRDLQGAVDEAIVARRPLLLVGHSMAGKTRLAAERIHKLLPDAQLLVPQSGMALREVVDAGLELTDVVVWLNDLERFLRGENALDTVLLDRLLRSRVIVVSTIRITELEGYRPGNDTQPPEWEVIRRFERLTLRRGYTAGELARIRAKITDRVVLTGIERYGLAEYLGAGPDAIEKFDDGETTCPIGHALVRAAVDWRRAGLANVVSLDDLREVLPSYLETRRDLAVDGDAVADGLAWATKRINETVALMRQWRPVNNLEQMAHPLYEVFDYLVDVIAARPDAPIPAQLWIQVASRAAGSEARDVARAANRYFTGRSRVMAQVASWLAAPATEPPHLMVVTGGCIFLTCVTLH